ncbi:MAG: hypothetical protein U9N72_03600 [Bacteroidota bacterium]|nr:hypothetical protein [Bacteroidota bacterium]
MSNKEDFDIFLEKQFRETGPNFTDDYFRNKVLENLPEQKKDNRTRNLILYVSVILSCAISFVIIDLNIIKNIVNEILNLLIYHKHPSLETVLFTLTFLIILCVIPKIEYSDGIS